jgi:mannose-6-phosphate isomerase-like protein (cupin superfamily)
MTSTDFNSDTLIDRSIIRLPDEGRKLSFDGSSTLFKITSDDSNDRLGVYEVTLVPGKTGAQLHYHRYMDETFIITQGILTVLLSDREEQAGSGSVMYIPRYTPHGFRNDTEEPVKLMLVFNPAHKREGFFEGLHMLVQESPVDTEKFHKLYQLYDSYPVGATEMLSEKQFL